ncbi:MAG: DUF1343 domain-containing protein [Deltaproteobacteria bacterium]|nr:DUF1343 domain-containing protein [Deltaproteobacteria bacterium]
MVAAQRGFDFLRGKRVGAICNPTAVDDTFRHLADLLREANGVTLAALFGPEHGVRGAAQDMIGVDSDRDPKTGVPVHSLYGKTFDSLKPTPESLQGLDALVFDIQDVGSRYYTFVYTMALCMQAAAKAKIPFFVLDRPNPIGLEAVEGNIVHEGFGSFVGMYPIATRHGMTAGELAKYFNVEHGIGCELTVIACEGLKRSMLWEDMGLQFVPPSPNMPTPDTALVYPGMCLAEGTNLNEGRGTTRPFEIFGAPYLDPEEYAAALTAEKLPGVMFRPLHFLPTFHKHAGKDCGGVMIHVTDKRAFLPVRTGAATMLHAWRQAHTRGFAWRTEKYEFVDDVLAIDLLFGTDSVRKGIEAGKPLDGCLDGFATDLATFQKKRARHLIYS